MMKHLLILAVALTGWHLHHWKFYGRNFAIQKYFYQCQTCRTLKSVRVHPTYWK